MLAEGAAVPVCVCARARVCVPVPPDAVLLRFLCNISRTFYLETHFPLHIVNNKHETT